MRKCNFILLQKMFKVTVASCFTVWDARGRSGSSSLNNGTLFIITLNLIAYGIFRHFYVNAILKRKKAAFLFCILTFTML